MDCGCWVQVQTTVNWAVQMQFVGSEQPQVTWVQLPQFVLLVH
jgi:hypothetical protein